MENEIEKTSNQNMNTLNLKFTNVSTFKPTIFVDGKKIKYKKDNFGGLTAEYKTEKNSVQIEIKKLYDINGSFWFLTSLFFFIISIFGIFDIKPDRRCLSIISTLKVNIKNNCSLKIGFKARTQLEKAFELEAVDCEIVEESGNNYFIDKVAKKRYKIMRIIKIFLWIALILFLTFVVLKNIM